MEKKQTRVLFVCLGNICRSPAGEGILKHLVAQDTSLNLFVMSCGIGDWHVGQGPDWRIREASSARGIVLNGRAQQFQKAFLDQFDYILASDHEVLRDLHRYAQTPEQKSKISLMTHYSHTYKGQEIPDPYYGGSGGFDLVLDMLQDSCEGLLEHIRKS